MYAAAAIVCSIICKYNQLTVVTVNEIALTEFQYVLIEWETMILEVLWTNRPIKWMSALKKEDYENEAQ